MIDTVARGELSIQEAFREAGRAEADSSRAGDVIFLFDRDDVP